MSYRFMIFPVEHSPAYYSYLLGQLVDICAMCKDRVGLLAIPIDTLQKYTVVHYMAVIRALLYTFRILFDSP
jgi:hypothetical protein